jgi:hypothetical protein
MIIKISGYSRGKKSGIQPHAYFNTLFKVERTSKARRGVCSFAFPVGFA